MPCLNSSIPSSSRHSAPSLPHLATRPHLNAPRLRFHAPRFHAPPVQSSPYPDFPCLPDLNSPCITFRLATLTHLACVTLPSSPRPTRTLLACHAFIIPTVPLPSIPLALTGFSTPAFPCLAIPLGPRRPRRIDPGLPPQTLPDPDAPRQPASAIPCLLLLAYPSFPDPYVPCASLPAVPPCPAYQPLPVPFRLACRAMPFHISPYLVFQCHACLTVCASRCLPDPDSPCLLCL
jgi:hypothetical protein